MQTVGSIDRMAESLRVAVSESDWESAQRYIERLKGIVLDGVARDDALAIQSAGQALQSCGQHVELRNKLAMKVNALALAWQLRADSATALLAQRIRPPASLAADIDPDVASCLLALLKESKSPLSNGELAEQSGKDPATISRTLKRLKASSKIRQWRVGRRVYNMARIKPGQYSPERQNIYALCRAPRSKSLQFSEPINFAPVPELHIKPHLSNPEKEAVQELETAA